MNLRILLVDDCIDSMTGLLTSLRVRRPIDGGRHCGSFVPQTDFFHFRLEIALECVCAAIVFRFGRIVQSTVGEYSCHISHK